MIDCLEIATSVLSEARVLATRHKYGDAPELTTDQVEARLLRDHPLPPTEQMASVIEEIFWTTLQNEEKRPCRPRLLYLSTPDPQRAVHWLEKTVSLDRKNLRKITLAQGPLGYLTWRLDSSQPVITGIQARQGGDPPELIIAGVDAGAIDIIWSSFRILSFRAGELRRLSACTLPDAQMVFERLRKMFGKFETVFLGSVVRTLIEQGHGGALWIARDDCSLNGISIGHTLTPKSFKLTERYPKIENRHPWLASIARLAAVDGAVLVNSSMHATGFAAFIDLKSSPEVIQQLPNGTQEQIPSSKLGGGRHRSAVEFCYKYAPAAAIVVSEDGRIMAIVAEKPDTPPWCAEISSLGFSS